MRMVEIIQACSWLFFDCNKTSMILCTARHVLWSCGLCNVYVSERKNDSLFATNIDRKCMADVREWRTEGGIGSYSLWLIRSNLRCLSSSIIFALPFRAFRVASAPIDRYDGMRWSIAERAIFSRSTSTISLLFLVHWHCHNSPWRSF